MEKTNNNVYEKDKNAQQVRENQVNRMEKQEAKAYNYILALLH